jgi:AbiU2
VPDALEIVEKLHSFANRLANNSLQALTLYEAWSALNVDSVAREVVVKSSVTKSIGVMWQATQDSLILCLMRALDGPRRDAELHTTKRVSFVVFRKLMDEPGVLDVLIGDAKSKFNGERGIAAGQAVANAADRLRARLDRLTAEEPNRVRRLRDVRNRYLAHHLQLANPVDPPIHENLRTMVDELLALADDAYRVLEPLLIEWPRGEVRAQTKRLIELIAAAHPPLPRGQLADP